MNRLEIYDDFKCLAEKCPFTCCRGWDISIDTDTYHSWADKQGLSECRKNNVIVAKHGKKFIYSINMGQTKICPFLDGRGLCKIVIEHGEEYQPKACRDFPRLSNSSGGRTEASLSLACPAVVNLLWNRKDSLKLGFTGSEQEPFEEREPLNAQEPLQSTYGYGIRNTMISLMQNHLFPLKDRLLLSFHLLMAIRGDQRHEREIRSKYESTPYLISLISLWEEAKPNYPDQLQEINELFLDITMNYRHERAFEPVLNEIYQKAEKLNIDDAISKLDEITQSFSRYEQLMENVLVSTMYSECTSDDLDQMIMSYQVIITEYLMVKHSAFLKWLEGENNGSALEASDNHEVKYQDIRNYVVVYSRIIGHNTEGMREFWSESFDEAIWEFGYLLLLLN